MSVTFRVALLLLFSSFPWLAFAEKTAISTDSSAQTAGASSLSASGASTSTSAAVTALSASASATSSVSSVSTSGGVSASPSNPWQRPQDVSYAGSFSYSYPIRLPSGTNGMAPSLALNYNSASPNDILGMGFSLSGLSTITRDPSFPVNFSAADRYLLDGQKLVFRAADSTFHTEKESFDRIQLFWASTGTTVQSDPNNAGAYWIIQKKDGTELTFGDPTSGTVNATIPALGKTTPRLWALSKVADANGNFYTISYTYEAATGAYYPLRIVYTQGNGLSTFKTVQFSYETRTDHAPMYIPTKVDLSQRLKWITVLMGTDAAGNGGALVRKYGVEYQYSVWGRSSQVTAIQEYGNDGNISVAGVLGTFMATGGLLPKVGLDWMNSGDTLFTHQGELQPETAWSSYKVSTGDFNGDGKADLVWNLVTSSGNTTYMNLSKGDGTFERAVTAWPMPGMGWSDFSFSVADVNGDGRSDLIWNALGTKNTTYVALSNQVGGFTALSSQTEPEPGWNPFTLRTGDFNGDGKTDLVWNAATSSANAVYMNLSRGDGTFERKVTAWLMPGMGWSDFSFSVADVNGDGRSDLIWNALGATNSTYVALSNQSGGFTVGSSQIHPATAWSSYSLLVDDITGDGRADLIWNERNTNNCTYVGRWGQGNENLLTQITLPTGGTITAAYTPAPQVAGAVVPANSNYLTGVANASPRSLVTTVTAYDGISHANDVVTTYQYFNGLKIPGTADVRTELGFQKVTKTTNGAATVSTFLQTKPLQGLVESVTVQDTAATPKVYSKANNSYTATEVIAGKVFFTPQTKVVTQQFDGAATSVSRKKTFEYDGFGNLTRTINWGIVNAAGNSIDESGNLNDQAQMTQDFTWASNAANLFRQTSRTVTAKDSNGVVGIVSQSKYFYDSMSFGGVGARGLATKLEESIDASTNAVTTRTYDAYGNPITLQDARVNAGEYSGPTQTLTYAAPYQDAVKTAANALNQTSTYGYDAWGQLVSILNPNGQTTLMSYDVFGRSVKTAAPLDDLTNPTTATEYSDALTPAPFPSWAKSKQKTSGTKTLDTYTYFDGLGRTIQTKRPATGGWITQDWYYDASGRNNAVSVPYFVSGSSAAFTTREATKKATSFSFDILDRVTATTHPDTTVSQTIYSQTKTTFVDENSHSRDVVDTGNVITQRAYDGVYPSQTLASTTTTRSYQGLTVVTDNAGNPIKTFTDRLDRRVRYENPDLGGAAKPWTYEYDKNGNLKAQTDALGHVLTFTYDKLNRVLTRNSAGDATVSAAFVYDELSHGAAPVGRLTSQTYHRGSDSTSYDARGRVSTQTRTLDGIAKTRSFTYDSMDRKVTETYPTSETVISGYGDDGNLVDLTGFLGGLTTSYVTNITYTDLGKVKTLAAGNGVMTTYNYYDDNTIDPFTGKDHSYRLRQILAGTGNAVMNLSYSYEKNDNVHSRADANNAAYNETYGYDAQNRLVSAVSGTNGSGQYGSLSYSYDPLNNLTGQSVNGLNYTMTYQASRPHAVAQFNADTYTYDANGNMLTGFGGRTIAYDVENRVTSVSDGGNYSYDAGRQRTIKTEGTKTHYSFFNNYEEEYTSGTLTNAVSYYSANNQKVAQSSTAQGLLFIHADHLGSSTRMTNSAGALVRTQGYQPYGNDSYVTGTATTKYQFTGQEKDAGGLYYYNARYYDPALGRFVQPDPALWSGEVTAGLTLDEQTNAYLYALNNPVVYTDPSGLDAIVLHAPKEAAGFGHAAILFGDDKTGWTYYSNDGSAEQAGNKPSKITGETHTAQGKDTGHFDSPADFFDTAGGKRYSKDNAEYIKTTSDQDAGMQRVATLKRLADKEYDLLTNNCSENVKDILEGGGVKVSGGLIPNYTFIEEKDSGKKSDSNKKSDSSSSSTSSSNKSSSSDSSSTSETANKKTVICTELYRQGLMDESTYSIDGKFGYWMEKNLPIVFRGYLIAATPIVKQMQESKEFTRAVYFFAKPWADEMVYLMGGRSQGNTGGLAVLVTGGTICLMVGLVGNYGIQIGLILLFVLLIQNSKKWVALLPTKKATIFIAMLALISQQTASSEDINQTKKTLVYAGIIREAKDLSKGSYFVKSNGITKNLVIPMKRGSELNNHQTKLIDSHLGALILDGTILLINNDTMESRILPGHTAVTNIFLGNGPSKLYFIESGILYQYLFTTEIVTMVADLSGFKEFGSFKFCSFSIDETRNIIISSNNATSSDHRIIVYHIDTRTIEDLREGQLVHTLVHNDSLKIYFADEKKGLGVFDLLTPKKVEYLISGEIDQFTVLSDSLIAFSLVDRNNFKGAPLLRGFSLYDSGKIYQIEDLLVASAVTLEQR